MKAMDIDTCVKYLISAYKVSPGKDPEACMECLCCLNPAIKEEEETYLEIYRCFLEWWFTRRDYLTNDLMHRVQTIIEMHRYITHYFGLNAVENLDKDPYSLVVVIDGKRYNASVLDDVTSGLIERALLRTLDR